MQRSNTVSKARLRLKAKLEATQREALSNQEFVKETMSLRRRTLVTNLLKRENTKISELDKSVKDFMTDDLIQANTAFMAKALKKQGKETFIKVVNEIEQAMENADKLLKQGQFEKSLRVLEVALNLAMIHDVPTKQQFIRCSLIQVGFKLDDIDVITIHSNALKMLIENADVKKAISPIECVRVYKDLLSASIKMGELSEAEKYAEIVTNAINEIHNEEIIGRWIDDVIVDIEKLDWMKPYENRLTDYQKKHPAIERMGEILGLIEKELVACLNKNDVEAYHSTFDMVVQLHELFYYSHQFCAIESKFNLRLGYQLEAFAGKYQSDELLQLSKLMYHTAYSLSVETEDNAIQLEGLNGVRKIISSELEGELSEEDRGKAIDLYLELTQVINRIRQEKTNKERHVACQMKAAKNKSTNQLEVRRDANDGNNNNSNNNNNNSEVVADAKPLFKKSPPITTLSELIQQLAISVEQCDESEHIEKSERLIALADAYYKDALSSTEKTTKKIENKLNEAYQLDVSKKRDCWNELEEQFYQYESSLEAAKNTLQNAKLAIQKVYCIISSKQTPSDPKVDKLLFTSADVMQKTSNHLFYIKDLIHRFLLEMDAKLSFLKENGLLPKNRYYSKGTNRLVQKYIIQNEALQTILDQIYSSEYDKFQYKGLSFITISEKELAVKNFSTAFEKAKLAKFWFSQTGDPLLIGFTIDKLAEIKSQEIEYQVNNEIKNIGFIQEKILKLNAVNEINTLYIQAKEYYQKAIQNNPSHQKFLESIEKGIELNNKMHDAITSLPENDNHLKLNF